MHTGISGHHLASVPSTYCPFRPAACGASKFVSDKAFSRLPFPLLCRRNRLEIAVQEIMYVLCPRAKGNAKGCRVYIGQAIWKWSGILWRMGWLFSLLIFHFPQLSMHIKVAAELEDNKTKDIRLEPSFFILSFYWCLLLATKKCTHTDTHTHTETDSYTRP